MESDQFRIYNQPILLSGGGGGGGTWDSTLIGHLLLLSMWGVLAIPSLLAATELGDIFVFLTVGLVETSLPKANSGFLPFRFADVSPKGF